MIYPAWFTHWEYNKPRSCLSMLTYLKAALTSMLLGNAVDSCFRVHCDFSNLGSEYTLFPQKEERLNSNRYTVETYKAFDLWDLDRCCNTLSGNGMQILY